MFCNAFKTYNKTRVKVNIVYPKYYTLHTVSTQKDENWKKRLWLEQVCKVCAHSSLLLWCYDDS